MKVAILLPVYNALPYIDNCLRTLLLQTYQAKVYVVDDASTDGTREWLFNRHDNLLATSVLVGNDVNCGWPATMNRAASLAIADHADALFLMNADDWLRLDAIEKMVHTMLTQNVYAVLPYAQQINYENTIMTSRENATLEDFAEHTVFTSFALIRSSVWTECGGYSTDVSIPELKAGVEDWEFWIKFIKTQRTYAVLKDPVYYYRSHADQLSRKVMQHYDMLRDLVHKKHF